MRIRTDTDLWDSVPPPLRVFVSHGRGDEHADLKYTVHRGRNCGDHGKCTVTSQPVLDKFGYEVDHQTEVGCECESDAYSTSEAAWPTTGCDIFDRCFGVECVHGQCNNGHCMCNYGYTGTNCTVSSPAPLA